MSFVSGESTWAVIQWGGAWEETLRLCYSCCRKLLKIRKLKINFDSFVSKTSNNQFFPLILWYIKRENEVWTWIHESFVLFPHTWTEKRFWGPKQNLRSPEAPNFNITITDLQHKVSQRVHQFSFYSKTQSYFTNFILCKLHICLFHIL